MANTLVRVKVSLLNGFRLFICHLVNISLILSQTSFSYLLTVNTAHATAPVDHIVVDGGTETFTDRAANNTPVVNIARPNDAGVSMNTYRDYNVLSDNLIINNFKGDAGLSQLGGALYGNPNFNKAGGREADLIVNQVTSDRITRLEGYTEIFGKRADLIVANPNGIITRGAGFINTSRLSLITGTPNLNSATGAVESFNINPTGEILITARNVDNGSGVFIPLGLDASSTDYVDIISRTVKVTAEIYAGNELNIKTGNKEFNYQTKEVTSDNNNSTTKPQISIDSSAFGGMYAGKIAFNSTEDGVGVSAVDSKFSADLDDISFSAKGDIEIKNSNVLASKNVKIETTNKVTINNSDVRAETEALEVSGYQLEITNNSLIASVAGNMSLDVGGDIINSAGSTIFSKGNLELYSADSLLNEDNSLIRTDGNLLFTAQNLTNQTDSTIYSKGSSFLIIASLLTNSGNSMIQSDYGLALFTTNLTNQNNSTIYSKEIADLNIFSEFTNSDNSLIQSDSLLFLDTENLTNQNDSSIFSKGDLFLTATSDLANKNDSMISSNGTMEVTSSSLFNQDNSTIFSNGNLSLNTGNGDLLNKSDSMIQTNGQLVLDSNNLTNLDNSTIFSKGDLTLTATANLVNDDNSLISTNAKAVITANSLTNQDNSTIFSDSDLTLSLNQISNSSSDIATNSNLTLNILNNNNLTFNEGFERIVAANLLTINANNIINNADDFLAQNSLIINASGNFTNNAGKKLNAMNFLRVNANNIYNYDQIAAGGDVVLDANGNILNSNNSEIFAGNDLEIEAGGNITNSNSEIFAWNDMYLTSGATLENTSGSIETYLGDIFIDAQNLVNKREYLPTQGGEVSYRSAAWFAGHGWHTNVYYRAEMIGDAAPEAQIIAKNNLIIDVDNLTNNSSSLISGNDLIINANNINNESNLFRDYVALRHWDDNFHGMYGTPGYDGGEQGYYYDGVYDGYINQAHILNATIKAGNNLNLSVINYNGDTAQAAQYQNLTSILQGVSNNTTISNTISITDPTDPDGGSVSGITSPSDPNAPTNPNAPINIQDTDLPPSIKKSEPDSKYLYETDNRFINVAAFLGSDYFLAKLGFDPDRDIDLKRMGDAHVEQTMIMKSLNKFTDFTYLEDDIQNDRDQVQRLYDNAFDQQGDGWEIGKPLTAEQKDNLTKDIIWLVEKNINGEKVLVPEIYLAETTVARLQENKNKEKGSVVKAGNNLTITASNNINSNLGSMISGNNLNLTSTDKNINLINTILDSGNNLNIVAKDLVNISNDQSLITTYSLGTPPAAVNRGAFSLFAAAAVTDPTPRDNAIATTSALTFNAGTDINITAGTVNIANNTSQAGGSIFITATTGDINNSNYVVSADQNIVLNAARDINNVATIEGIKAGQETRMSAGNILSANAGNNINNIGATLEGGNLVYLNAGNDINNEALIERRINGRLATRDEIENSNADHISSALLAQGNINSNSGNVVLLADNGNINNVASNINAGGEAYLEATNGDVNITTDILRQREVQRYYSKKSSLIIESDQTRNIASSITTGNGSLNIVSGGDTNIKGSDITINNGDFNNDASGNLNITSAQDSNSYSVQYNKKGSFGRKSSFSSNEENVTQRESNITVNGGDINTGVGQDINIIASNLTSNNINLNADGNITISAAADTSLKESSSSKKGTTIMKTSTDIKYDLVNVHSDLNATGNINISTNNATSDINLIGTNLNSGNNIDINAADELNVYAVADQHYSYQDSSKTRSFATIAKYTGASFGFDAMNDTMNFIDNINPVNHLSGNQEFALGAGIMGVGNSSTANTRGWNSFYQNTMEGDFNAKSKSTEKNDKIYQLAELTATNNINLTSNNDLTLIGANLTSDQGTVTSTNGDVNIMNVKDEHYEDSESFKDHTTIGSSVAGLARNSILGASNSLVGPDLTKNPEKKDKIYAENEEAMKEASRKTETNITKTTDETVVASNLNFNDLTINAGNDTNITSSSLNTANDLNINSTNNTTISTAVENDATFTLTEKKVPSIFAAISNGIVKLAKDTFPDLTPWEGPDEKKDNERKAREEESLGHQAHTRDFQVETKTDNPMLNGYTISNNDADEMAIDLALDKVTKENTINVASNLAAGNDININSTNGNNIIIASNLAAGNDININSLNGETVITSAGDQLFQATSTVDQEYNDMSLEYNRGRISISSESRVEEEDNKTTSIEQIASELLAGNNINVNTKNDISVLSSNLTANNEINLISNEGNTNILANQNSTLSETEIREGTMKLSAGLNHVAVDAIYAADDMVKATESLKDAQENLERMKDLKKQGKATDEAVDDAKINLEIAKLNVALSVFKMAAAADKAKSSSKSWGFYFDLRLERSGDKTNIVQNQTQEIASNIIAENDIVINSGLALATPNSDLGNTNIKGNITSNSGNIEITSANDTNIDAIKSTSTSSMKSEGFTQTVTLGASYGKSSAQQMVDSLMAQISVRSSKSNETDVTYENTILNAGNGNLIITSLNDTDIKGANLSAENVILNTGNDLSIASLQNENHYKSKSKSVGVGGGKSSASLSYSSNREKFDRVWVDDQTDVIGTNSVTINTGNNTNLKGSLVANIDQNGEDQGNLAINTKTFTYQDIIDTEKQEKEGINASLTVNFGKDSKGNSTAQPSQQNNYHPKGSLSLGLQDTGYEKEQITRATVGEGAINITDNSDIANLNRDITKKQEITKDIITGALDVNTTIDLRLLDWTGKGQKEMFNELVNLPENAAYVAGRLARVDNLILDFALATSSELGTKDVSKALQNQKNTNDIYVKSAVSTLRDNITGNGENSSFDSELERNQGIANAITKTQENKQLSNNLNSLTKYDGKGVQDTLQQAADYNDQYSGNDTHDGKVVLYQDGSENSPEAFSYDNKKGYETININTSTTDLTDSGDVINKLYHEGANFDDHRLNEVVAQRSGDFAENLWNSNSITNNYYDLNLITNNQWNQQHTIVNDRALAVGTSTSYVQYTYDKKNTNDFIDPATGLEAASFAMGTTSLYQNLKDSKYKDAAVDAAGLIFDGLSILSPTPTGFASASIQAARSGDNVMNLITKEIKGESSILQKDRVLSNIAESKAARESSNFSGYLKNEGKVQENLGIWPPNDGFEGNILYKDNDTLLPGYEFDRYGDKGGTFVAPKDTPFEGRSLPSIAKNKPRNTYEVIKPIENVVTGTATPWFGQRGRDPQHKLPDSIKNLEQKGFIKSTNNQ